MASTDEGRPFGEHAWRALTAVFDFLLLKVAAQRSSIAKSGVQVAAFGAFGLATLVWLELTVYFAVEGMRGPTVAALATMILNVIALCVSNALVLRWKRENHALLVALEKREAAVAELRETRVELLGFKDQVISSTTDFVHDRIVLPVERYKMPVAIGITFVTGVFVARALFPPQSRL